MKLIKQIALFSICVVTLLSSCTMEKRHYQSGYYIDWKHKNEAAAKVNNKKDVAKLEEATVAQQTQVNNTTSTPVVVESTPATFTASNSNQMVLVEKNVVTTTSNQVSERPAVKAKTVFAAAKEAKKIIREEKKQNKEANGSNKAAKGEKSQLIALILVALLGGLGIHRFYLGYTWQGIVQLLTLGGCGVWALIDLIRIIMGTLGPKDGDYDETL